MAQLGHGGAAPPSRDACGGVSHVFSIQYQLTCLHNNMPITKNLNTGQAPKSTICLIFKGLEMPCPPYKSKTSFTINLSKHND